MRQFYFIWRSSKEPLNLIKKIRDLCQIESLSLLRTFSGACIIGKKTQAVDFFFSIFYFQVPIIYPKTYLAPVVPPLFQGPLSKRQKIYEPHLIVIVFFIFSNWKMTQQIKTRCEFRTPLMGFD